MHHHLGTFFFGHVFTFIFLTQSAAKSEHFVQGEWARLSLYNFLISEVWPLYWIGYALASDELNRLYWNIYNASEMEVWQVYNFVASLIG